MAGDTIKGRTVFITGAASGIGFEVALAFAREGAAIVATDVVQAGLDNLRPEVEKLGVAFRDALLDVSDEAAFEALAAQLAEEGQLPDIVVNNAGIGYMNPFLDTTPEQWRRTLDINVLGVAWGSRVFVRLWQERGIAGHLVNIASGASVTPMPNMAAYAASQYAVEGLCEVLQMELGNRASVFPALVQRIRSPVNGKHGVSTRRSIPRQSRPPYDVSRSKRLCCRPTRASAV